MPVVRMPDGALVNMPDNPSPEMLARLKKLTAPVAVAPQVPKERPGFLGSFKESMETLGLTDEAAVYAANPTEENRKKFLDAAKSKYESVGFGQGENWEAFKEMLGSSLGQMVAPIAAATAGSFATPIAGAAAGASTIASQYGIQNLLRQAQEQEQAAAEGRAPEELSLGKAAAATAGETALDVLQFKKFKALYEAFPMVRNLVGGGKGAKDAAEAIVDAAKEGTLKTTKQGIVTGAVKGVAFEVPQEVAQQALERWQAGLSVTDADAMEEFKQAAIGAALLGPAIGGASGYMDVRRARRAAEDIDLGLGLGETGEEGQTETIQKKVTPEEGSRRVAVLNAIDAAGVPTKASIREATKLPDLDVQAELNALKNEGVIKYGGSQKGWVFTDRATADAARTKAEDIAQPQMDMFGKVPGAGAAPTEEQIRSMAERLNLSVPKDATPEQILQKVRSVQAATDLINSVDVRGQAPAAEQIRSVAEGLNLGIPENAAPEQILQNIRTAVQSATVAPETQQQGMQYGLDLPGAPIEQLAPKDRLLRAIPESKSVDDLQRKAKVPLLEMREELAKLEAEGAVTLNKDTGTYELTSEGGQRATNIEAQLASNRRGPELPAEQAVAGEPGIEGIGGERVDSTVGDAGRLDEGKEGQQAALTPDLFPRVDAIKSVSVGPATIKPIVVAEGKPLYHETNASGLEDILRSDQQADYKPIFVSDDSTLAIGQRDNTGVNITFRPNSISGAENKKPGTGVIGGREYKADIIAPRAVQDITVKDAKTLNGLRPFARGILNNRFTKTVNKDGSITFTRKPAAAKPAEAAKPAAKPAEAAKPAAPAASTAPPAGTPTTATTPASKASDPFDDDARQSSTPEEQRATGTRFVNNVGSIPNNLPPGTDNVANGTRDALIDPKLPRPVRQGAFSFLSLFQLGKMFRRYTDNLNKMFDLQNREGASVREGTDVIGKELKKWRKVLRRYSPAQQARFFKLMHDTTVEQVEVLNYKDANLGIDWTADPEHSIAKQFNDPSFPEPVRQVYKELRIAYARHAKNMEAALSRAVTPNEWAKIQNELMKKKLRVYLPLFRMGDYKVSYTDKKGERVARSFTTDGERDRAINELVRSGIRRDTITQTTEAGGILASAPPTGFYGRTIAALREKGVDDSVISEIFELYMDTLPIDSVMQMRRARNNTAGYEADPLLAYANIAPRYVKRTSNVEYQPQIEEAHQNFLADIGQGQYWLQYKDSSGKTVRNGFTTAELRRKAAQAALQKGAQRNSFDAYELDPNASADLQQTVRKQLNFYRNPSLNNVVNQAGYFSYLMFLGGNISSAVVDITHSPMVVYGILGGKHGWGNAFAAMSRSNKYFLSPNTRPEDIKRMYERAKGDGLVGEKRPEDIAEFKKLGSAATDVKAGADRVVNLVFAKSDKYQRETTFFSAYELAKEALRKKGLTGTELENAAYEDAKQVVFESYGSAFPKAGPSISGNQLARLALTFKQFAINRMWLITTTFRDAAKGESKEVRDIARTQLIGYFAMAYVFSGVQGMPFVGGAEALADLLNGIFGDDDEPYSAKNKVREAVGMFNFKGPLNYIFNVDIASRSGWDNMMWRDDPKRVDDIGVVGYTFEQLFGPAYSYAVGAEKAIETMKDGNLSRGLEQLAPRFVANIMKGFRYGTEGATLKDGTPIVEDIGRYNQFMQVLGFSPADVAATYEKGSALIEQQKGITERASKIRNRMVMAIMNQDEPSKAMIAQEIQRFNAKNPGAAITGESVRQSLTRLRNKINRSVAGVTLRPKLAQQVIRDTGYETEEEEE